MINIWCGSMVRVNSNEGAPSLTPVSKSVSKVSLWTFVVSQYRRLKASKGLASAGLMFFTLTISVKSHHKKIVRTHFEAVRRKRIILLPRLQVGENRNRNGSKNKETHLVRRSCLIIFILSIYKSFYHRD